MRGGCLKLGSSYPGRRDLAIYTGLVRHGASGHAALLSALALVVATAASAQDTRIANPAASQLGQRQRPNQAAQGIAPTARISSRVQNRIQSRIRNRIDRDYNAQADATSSFKIASDQARVTGKPPRR